MVDLAELAVIITIFGPIGLAILLFSYLRWKINQVGDDLNYMRQVYTEYEKRLREVEIKVHAYNLARSILDRQEDKEK